MALLELRPIGLGRDFVWDKTDAPQAGNRPYFPCETLLFQL
jgi:hypothetical protein